MASEDTKELYSPKNTWGKGYEPPPSGRRGRASKPNPRLRTLTEAKIPVGAIVDGLGAMLKEHPDRLRELKEALASSRGTPTR